MLALYAFQVLPISYAGLGLILLGIGFMVAEAFMPSFGALGIGGLIAFVVGSIILFDTDARGLRRRLAADRRGGRGERTVLLRCSVSGHEGPPAPDRERRREELVGATGEALEDFAATDRVRVHSEEWQARTHLGAEARAEDQGNRPRRPAADRGTIIYRGPLT